MDSTEMRTLWIRYHHVAPMSQDINLSLKVDQQFLVSSLEQLLGPQIKLAAWLEEHLNLHYTNVYKRIRGEVKFTEAEVFHLCQLLPDLGEMVLTQVFNHKVGVILVNGYQDEQALQRQLYRSIKLLNGLVEQPNQEVMYVARDVPFFYFLADHKLFLFKYNQWNSKNPLTEFAPKTKELMEQLYQVYLQLNTRELWYTRAFDHQFDQVDHLVVRKLLEEGAAEDIRHRLEKLQALHQEWRHNLMKSTGRLELRYLPYMTMNNGAFFRREGKPMKFIGALYDAFQYELIHPVVLQGMEDRFEELWKQGGSA